MKFYYLALTVLLLAACVPIEQMPQEPQEQPPACTAAWVCAGENARAYQREDCAYDRIEDCPNGCQEGICLEAQPELTEQPEAIQPEVVVVEEEEPQAELQEISEEEQLKTIFSYATTKIKSYKYKYTAPSGQQYNIYVKDNLMKIDYLSSPDEIFIDTTKKTAEEWCTSYSKCGAHTGKIKDLDYNTAYVKTPIDWLGEITDAVKLDDGFYFQRQGWELSTNIGTVIIDSNYGFIMSIKQQDKTYLFTETVFNTLTDSDVTVPEYLRT
jgi:hypothetical protein